MKSETEKKEIIKEYISKDLSERILNREINRIYDYIYSHKKSGRRNQIEHKREISSIVSSAIASTKANVDGLADFIVKEISERVNENVDVYGDKGFSANRKTGIFDEDTSGNIESFVSELVDKFVDIIQRELSDHVLESEEENNVGKVSRSKKKEGTTLQLNDIWKSISNYLYEYLRGVIAEKVEEKEGIKKRDGRKDREDRYEIFSSFQNDAVSIFGELQREDSSASIFEEVYMLNICPGGRMGRDNDRIVDVFFGSRSYDYNVNLSGSRKVFREQGASLLFMRNDDGYITIKLYPAHIDSGESLENSILLDDRIHPRKLKNHRFIKSIWNDFITYMTCTCLDGHPTLKMRFRVIFLESTRTLIVEGKKQPRKICNVVNEVLKNAIMIFIGFSSSWLVTRCNDSLCTQIVINAPILNSISKPDTMMEQHNSTCWPVKKDTTSFLYPASK